MSLSITWADVVAVAPELSSVDLATQTKVLADTAAGMNEDVWGPKLNTAAPWLAAHLATLTKRSGTGGQVISESVGQVSRTYASSVAQGSGMYGSTVYGVEFERIMKTLPAARFVVA